MKLDANVITWQYILMLDLAVITGDFDLVKYLVKKGAELTPDYYPGSKVRAARGTAMLYGQYKIAEYLKNIEENE